MGDGRRHHGAVRVMGGDTTELHRVMEEPPGCPGRANGPGGQP